MSLFVGVMKVSPRLKYYQLWRRRADVKRLIRDGDMTWRLVSIAVDGHGPDAELFGRFDDATCDFTAIGD